MNTKTKKLTMIAMLVAAAFVAVSLFRIPIVLFLKYEPKDVIITIGGFLFGPLTAFLVSLFVSIIEMFTISDTGIIGAIMNLLSSCAFACT
ncbi:MAG: ECF transporter S component, partial [Traorella sp.]